MRKYSNYKVCEGTNFPVYTNDYDCALRHALMYTQRTGHMAIIFEWVNDGWRTVRKTMRPSRT